ncbi:DNA-3-methyladenine glycosylase [Candidatus Parcubacteria bacterium]|nr:DNA-3-methyladenine glycosylase [Candidatus Parcubacteria bacterium]
MSMLSKSFFERDALVLAPALLGCELVHQTSEGVTSGIIVETECYSQDDAASHSYRGQTERTKVMFGPGGYAYIYFTYGMHYCFNVVSGPAGHGQGILIRALEPKSGVKIMQKRRGFLKTQNSGIGSRGSHLSAMGNFSSRNGQSRTGSTAEGVQKKKIVHSTKKQAESRAQLESRLADVNLTNGPAKLVQALGITKQDYGRPLFEENLYIKERLSEPEILAGPRIGIKQAIDKPWRFWIPGSSYVSKTPPPQKT